MRREYRIVDESGLHARPASLLSQEASKHANDIFLEYNEKRVTLKSVMLVMSLAVPTNEVITVDVDGDNPELVFTKLEEVMNDNKLI